MHDHDGEEERSDVTHKVIIAGLVIGGTMVTVGPMAGMFGTFSGLKTSFEAVGSTDSAHKAEKLSQGIDDAMEATNAGMGVAAVGGVIASICAILLWRRAKAKAKAQATRQA